MYPNSDQRGLIVKRLISSIDSAPFFKGFDGTITLIKPQVDLFGRQRIVCNVELSRKSLSITIDNFWAPDEMPYCVSIPIKWNKDLKKNIVTVCVEIRDHLYEYFDDTPQKYQPFLDDWNYVVGSIFTMCNKCKQDEACDWLDNGLCQDCHMDWDTPIQGA